jgi:hypothetical protein
MFMPRKSSKTVTVEIEAKILWQVARDPDSGEWVGVCQMLNLNAIGDTWAEMMECANEAMGLLMDNLFQTGELDAFLRKNNWRPTTNLPAAGTKTRFDVPFDWERTSIGNVVAAAHA